MLSILSLIKIPDRLKMYLLFLIQSAREKIKEEESNK